MNAASAPGKLILVGEHAVVYRRPAIAVPLNDLRAVVEATELPSGSGLIINALDLGRRFALPDAPDDPLTALANNLLVHLAAAPPDMELTITSTIPIAGGMGSGAAVATALVRALSQFLGKPLPGDDVAALVYRSEQRLHGTPSGIDNTVIAYNQPIWFVRNAAPPNHIEPLHIAARLTLLIGDTGVRSATRLPVGDLRRRYDTDPAHYEALFDAVGTLASDARAALAAGDLLALGPVLSANHDVLQQLGVSSPALDALVSAARGAGALGAKLSGAGWGGVMLALVTPEQVGPVRDALLAAGATQVLQTTVAPTTSPR